MAVTLSRASVTGKEQVRLIRVEDTENYVICLKLWEADIHLSPNTNARGRWSYDMGWCIRHQSRISTNLFQIMARIHFDKCRTNIHRFDDLVFCWVFLLFAFSVCFLFCFVSCILSFVFLIQWFPPGRWFNIKMPSHQYRKSHCGDKTILRPSYLHNGISYTGKTTSLYWIRAHGA